MKKTKKILAIILVLLLGLTLLSACGGALEDPPPLAPPRVRDPNAPAPPVNPGPTNPDPSGPTGDSDYSDDMIPATGGTFNISQQTEFTFIPGQSGVWEFRTSNNAGDPYLELYGGEYGGMITEDDDSGGGSNALITWILREGAEYRLVARNWSSGDSGSFVLTVQQINPVAIPGGGGSVNVDGETFFIFIPNASGMWEFITSDNGSYDPKLHIYDADGFELYDDDDSADGTNALINARLQSGTTYYIRASFFWDSDGRYLLTVTPN